MRRSIFAAILAVSVMTAGAVKADTFVYRDVKNGYTMSFPDSWRMQTGDQPDTQLRIAGPIAEDMATCRMEVRHDGRSLIYPKRLVDEAAKEKLGDDFWAQETGQYLNAKITSNYYPAGLGDKGDATAIRVSFLQKTGDGGTVQMHGISIASLYGSDLYVASCASKHEMYERYAAIFGEILDSVMLESKYHPFATGYYRNFLLDEPVTFVRSKPGTISENGTSWLHWPWHAN